MGKEQDKFLRSIPKGQEIWCTEINLLNVLSTLFPSTNIIHDKNLKLSGYNIRPDYYIPEFQLAVEYQGPRHFTEVKTINRDTLKRILYEENKITCVELPYFIQPTKEVLSHLFKGNKHVKDFNNGFPHGFIHPDAVILGDFNRCGLINAAKIIKIFPLTVREDMYYSLQKRSEIDDIVECMYNPFIVKNLVI